jgi:hypothetical protein
MGDKMRILKIILLILLFPLISFSQRIEIENSILSDNENTLNIKFVVDYYHKMDKNYILGGGVGILNFSDTNQIILYDVDIRNHFSLLKNKIEMDLNLYDNFNSRYNFFLYDCLFKFKPNRYLYTEVFSSKELIGTTFTIENKDLIYSNGIVSDIYLFNQRLTITGGYIYQYYTDINHRNIGIIKLYTNPVDKWYLFLSTKFINCDSTKYYYFSPKKFNTYGIGTFYIFNLNKDKFILKPTIVLGKQDINDEFKNFYSIEVKFKGWIHDKYGMDFIVGYSNSINDYGNYNFFYCNLKFIYCL